MEQISDHTTFGKIHNRENKSTIFQQVKEGRKNITVKENKKSEKINIKEKILHTFEFVKKKLNKD